MIRKHRHLFLALAIAAIIIAGTIFYNEYQASRYYNRTSANWSLIVPAVTAEDHTIGDMEAPIQVIVYSDFNCGYCRRFFSETLTRLSSAFGDHIVVAYRHLIILGGEDARQKAESTECAYQSGGDEAFWKFKDEMFAAENFQKSIGPSRLRDIAVDSGADRVLYEQCIADGRGKERIERDQMQASIAGLTQTPGIVLKSKYRALIIRGDYPAQIATGIAYLLRMQSEIERSNAQGQHTSMVQ
ncbi:hypothetical protein C4568_04320 [Candidatus Parcubacteria bacterium]|nr:MAG: hypothetical protein C4568_04320 [Candidatus Parcubacteria bacterium]